MSLLLVASESRKSDIFDMKIKKVALDSNHEKVPEAPTEESTASLDLEILFEGEVY